MIINNIAASSLQCIFLKQRINKILVSTVLYCLIGKIWLSDVTCRHMALALAKVDSIPRIKVTLHHHIRDQSLLFSLSFSCSRIFRRIVKKGMYFTVYMATEMIKDNTDYIFQLFFHLGSCNLKKYKNIFSHRSRCLFAH